MGRRSWMTTRTGETDAYSQAAQMAVDAAEKEARKNPTVDKWAQKGETVAADTAAGCTLGPYGCVGGAAVGLVQAFGSDVADALNPPDFSEDDYTRIKGKCVKGYNGGPPGEIVGGIAPDQYGACRYRDPQDPTGYVYSGGDAPFPGSWNMGWDSDGKIIDQAAWDRWHGPLCGGVPLPPGMVCVNGQPQAPPPAKPLALSSIRGSRLLGALDAETNRRAQLQNLSKMPATTVAKIIATPTPARKTFNVATVLNPAAAARATDKANTIAALAQSGNVDAKAAIGDIAIRAQAGDPLAQVQAHLLTQAAKLQIRAKYIRKYLGVITTGSAPMTTSCGCRPH